MAKKRPVLLWHSERLATTFERSGVASNWLLINKVNSSSSLKTSTASLMLLGVSEALPLSGVPPAPAPGSSSASGSFVRGTGTGTSCVKHRLSESSLMASRWWLPAMPYLGNATWKRSTPTSACLDLSITRMQGGRDSPADAVAKSRNFCQSLLSKRSAKEVPGWHESTKPFRRVLPTILNCWSKRTSPDAGVGSGPTKCHFRLTPFRSETTNTLKWLMPAAFVHVMRVSHQSRPRFHLQVPWAFDESHTTSNQLRRTWWLPWQKKSIRETYGELGAEVGRQPWLHD